MTAEYGEGSGPLRVIGKPDRRSGDSIKHDRFSCIFGFQQEVNGNVLTEGTNRNPFVNVEVGDTVTPGNDDNNDGTISITEQQDWLDKRFDNSNNNDNVVELASTNQPFNKFSRGNDLTEDRCNNPVAVYSDSCPGS